MPPPPRASARRRGVVSVLLGAAALVLASALVGLLVNHFSSRGIPLFAQVEAGQPALPQGLKAASLSEAKEAADGKSALLLDARPPEEYAAGHLPGALNVPPDRAGEALLNLGDKVEQAPAVIVYCAGSSCGDAITVAEYVVQVAPEKVSVFVGGWAAWQAAGYPVEKGEPR